MQETKKYKEMIESQLRDCEEGIASRRKPLEDLPPGKNGREKAELVLLQAKALKVHSCLRKLRDAQGRVVDKVKAETEGAWAAFKHAYDETLSSS